MYEIYLNNQFCILCVFIGVRGTIVILILSSIPVSSVKFWEALILPCFTTQYSAVQREQLHRDFIAVKPGICT